MSNMSRAFAVLFALAVLFGRTDTAFAQPEVDLQRVIEVTQSQEVAIQRMAREALLVALGIEQERNLERLAASRAGFDRALLGLRDGDPELGLPVADAEVRDAVDRALGFWQQMDEAVGDGLEDGRFSPAQVARIATLNMPLQGAVRAATKTYADRSPRSQHFSMLVAALDQCEAQKVRAHQMAKEFLLIAYGFEPATQRRQLRESIAEFDAALNGLINGDLELALLPAPTAPIRGKLLDIEALWDGEVRPLLVAAADGDSITIDAAARVARATSLLVEEMEIARRLYAAL